MDTETLNHSQIRDIVSQSPALQEQEARLATIQDSLLLALWERDGNMIDVHGVPVRDPGKDEWLVQLRDYLLDAGLINERGFRANG